MQRVFLNQNLRLRSILVKFITFTILALGASASIAEEKSEAGLWETFLKDRYFKDVDLIEDKTVIDLTTPYRAEDSSVTPVSVTAQIPQTKDHYIEKIYIFVDKNPEPLVGTFTLSPDMGRADLAMRVRVNEYTNIRAIAVLNNGEHHMVSNFVKAQGGCSAPLGADLKAAMARMGKMKFRTIETTKDGYSLSQYMVSHPNITGMQLDQRTRLIAPAHYVKKIAISYNGKPILTADVGFSVSADPSFRFFFKPDGEGTVTATVLDSDGEKWTQDFDVSG